MIHICSQSRNGCLRVREWHSGKDTRLWRDISECRVRERPSRAIAVPRLAPFVANDRSDKRCLGVAAGAARIKIASAREKDRVQLSPDEMMTYVLPAI